MESFEETILALSLYHTSEYYSQRPATTRDLSLRRPDVNGFRTHSDGVAAIDALEGAFSASSSRRDVGNTQGVGYEKADVSIRRQPFDRPASLGIKEPGNILIATLEPSTIND